jgi:hypothetical protein
MVSCGTPKPQGAVSNPYRWAIQFEANPSLGNQFAEVDVIGASEDLRDQLLGIPVTKYFTKSGGENSPMRKVALTYGKTLTFKNGVGSSPQVLDIKDPLWNQWGTGDKARFLILIANVPSGTSDQNCRKVLPYNKKAEIYKDVRGDKAFRVVLNEVGIEAPMPIRPRK